jgi:hypothetical protein
MPDGQRVLLFEKSVVHFPEQPLRASGFSRFRCLLSVWMNLG